MGSVKDDAKCPKCGTWGAKLSFFKTKCVNPGCEKYNAEWAAAHQRNRIVGQNAAEVFGFKGKADPDEYPLRIRYRNFRGDELVYSADPASGYIKNKFLVIRLAPTGRRATFKLANIQNRYEVESKLVPPQPQPNPQERKVLNFHFRHGTTSRLFEEMREKYPNYHP
jgi:hypothetical protein